MDYTTVKMHYLMNIKDNIEKAGFALANDFVAILSLYAQELLESEVHQKQLDHFAETGEYLVHQRIYH